MRKILLLVSFIVLFSDTVRSLTYTQVSQLHIYDFYLGIDTVFKPKKCVWQQTRNIFSKFGRWIFWMPSERVCWVSADLWSITIVWWIARLLHGIRWKAERTEMHKWVRILVEESLGINWKILADCTAEDGSTCTNGVCLDHQCHCNDGFGGCNCQSPGKSFIFLWKMRFHWVYRRWKWMQISTMWCFCALYKHFGIIQLYVFPRLCWRWFALWR